MLEGQPIMLIIVLGIGITVALVLLALDAKSLLTKGKFMKTVDYMRQKLLPALNETTGFLAVSFVVIMCVGNIIMRTSPKYLTSFDQVVDEEASGFVAWLQSQGLSWLSIVIPVAIVSVVTILPLENKLVKTGLIGGTLLGAFMMALFFNVLKKLFSPKEKEEPAAEAFTNIKEEFGHTEEQHKEQKNSRHPLKLTVGDNLNMSYTDDKDTHTENNLDSTDEQLQLNFEHWDTEVQLNTKPNNKTIFYSYLPYGIPDSDKNLKRIYKKEKDQQVHRAESVKDVLERRLYFHKIPENVYIFKNKDKINNSSYCIQDEDTGLWKISDPKPSFDDYYNLSNNFSLKNTIKKLSIITNLKDTSGNPKDYKIFVWNDNYFTAQSNGIANANVPTSEVFIKTVQGDILLMLKNMMKSRYLKTVVKSASK